MAYIGIHGDEMGLYSDYIRIMERKMETTL